MSKITYGEQTIELAANESVLDALLRSQVDVPYSCKNGVCQSCLLQTDPAAVPEHAQESLSAGLREQGYFLPCICKPEGDLHIRSAHDNLYQSVEVLEAFQYNNRVMRIRLTKPEDFEYRAGQFIHLKSPADPSLIRSYSLASHPQIDDYLEIQVRCKDNGEMSTWLFDNLKAGDEIYLQGPAGLCYYSSEAQRKMLFIGTSTGISPLSGVLSDALQQEHRAEIKIFYGSRYPVGLYLLPSLLDLEKRHENVSVQASLSGEVDDEDEGVQGISKGRALDFAFRSIEDIADYDIYICGNAAMASAAQRRAYLAGVPLARIFVHAFEHKDLRKNPRS